VKQTTKAPAASRRLVATVVLALAAAGAQAAEPADHAHDHDAAGHESAHEHGTGHESTRDHSAGHEHHGEHAGHSEHDAHDAHGARNDDEPTESERHHVPPPPPQHEMGEMSNAEMIELMAMDDAASVGMVLVDKLEWRNADDDVLAWDAQAWFGSDYHKLWLESEGERVAGEYEGRVELMWDRVLSRWWNVQAGVRQDFGDGPSRSWLGFGVQGLAPYWFEVEAKVYVGEEGRTAARLAAEYDLLLTQRLILQPQFELALHGKDDPANGIGSGLSETEVGLRLRYEIRRELAPYVGVVWHRVHGATADLAQAAGHDRSELQLVLGLRAWF
jgi:copper resistance protein B